MLTRSFTNAGEVTDWTQEVNYIPRTYSKIGSLGLFEEIPVAADTVSFDVITGSEGILGDKVRGERAFVGKDQTRTTKTWPIAHWPMDDFILPGDARGKRAYNSPDGEDELSAVRARKLERLNRIQADFLEFSRAKLITTGAVYAPNGTVSVNYFTEFGQTQTTVSFALGTGTTDVLSKQENCIATIQDNLLGSNMSEVIAICSPEFFSAYISHASVKDAYKYYTSSQEILRQRAGNSATAFYREFVHGNVRLIEIRDSLFNQRLIDAGSAYFLPAGSDIFKTFFGPANKFGLAGTLGEKMYAFEIPNGAYDDKIVIQSESNFINAVTKANVIVKGTLS